MLAPVVTGSRYVLPTALVTAVITVVLGTGIGLPAVSGADPEPPPGMITGVVGESGSGKFPPALSLLNAVQPPGGKPPCPLAGRRPSL